jgi:hypothetical protein
VTVVAAAVLVDVVVIQSEVTVSVTTSGCGSGARLSRLMSRLLALSRRSLLSLRYFDISKGAALSATRRNLALAKLLGRVTEIDTVGVIVQIGSRWGCFVGLMQLAVAVFVVLAIEREYLVNFRVSVLVVVTVTLLGVTVVVGLMVVDGLVTVTGAKVVTVVSVVVLVESRQKHCQLRH